MRMRTFAMIFAMASLFTQARAGAPLHFYTEEWIPFNYTNEAGNIDGFTTAVVKKIAHNLGTKVEIEVQPWSRALQSAQSAENKVIYSVYRTPEREKLFKWVGPIHKVETVLWGLEESKLSIRNLEDAKQYKIAVQADSAYVTELEKKGFNKSKIVSNYATQEIEMVIRGTADLVPLSILSITKLNARTKDQQSKTRIGSAHWKPYATLFSDELYLGFNLATPDATVAEWQKELNRLKDSSFYKDIEKTYVSPIVSEANRYR